MPESTRTDLREIIYGSHRVIYRTDPDQVVALTVRSVWRARRRLRQADPG
ncbi:MAG: hypothetical protein ACJ8J0_02790 [Longimicrobiaceae bacterium]